MNPLSERLRSRREELTLSVKEISARTKIRPNVINALEEGNFDVLPRVYITSFVRNYGALLEISDEELDELWIASGLDNPVQEPAGFSLSNVLQSGRESSSPSIQPSSLNSQTKPPTKIKPVQPTPRIISAIVYSAFVLGCSALVYYFFIRETPKPKSPGEAVPTAEIRPESGEGGLLNSLFDESLPKDSIILEASATDSVWLTINADGTRSDQLLMTPGTSKRWSAKTQFILSLGNAGAIDLKRDNVALPSLGKKGTALRYVKITKNEVNTSASPYKNQDSLARLAAIAAEKKAAALKAANAKNPPVKPATVKPAQQQPKQTITQPKPITQPKQTLPQPKQMLPQPKQTVAQPKQTLPQPKESTPITKPTVQTSDKQTQPPAKSSNKPATVTPSPQPSKQGNPLKIAPPPSRNKLILKNTKPKPKQATPPKKKQTIPIITPAPLKSPGYKPPQPPRH
jgi:transcriptional regulator with XRE-family HTH domain